MKPFHEYMTEYRKQIERGDIKEAYKGLMEYIMELRLYFKNKYPEYFVLWIHGHVLFFFLPKGI